LAWGWLHTEVVYPSEDVHPSQYSTNRAQRQIALKASSHHEVINQNAEL